MTFALRQEGNYLMAEEIYKKILRILITADLINLFIHSLFFVLKRKKFFLDVL